MLKRTFILSTALTGLIASPAFAGDTTLTIENFIGKIAIETGSKLKVTNKQNSSDVDFDRSGDTLTIDGGISEPDGEDCKGYYGRGSWSFFSKKEKKGDFGGYENLDDYPNLTISAPENVTLVIKNAIPFGTISDIGAADIEMSYCGNLKMHNIDGAANLNIRGSGDISALDIGTVKASINGSGDLEFENTTDAIIKVRGSGDVDFGDADNADITVSGSGDIEMGNIAEMLHVESAGSGDVSSGDVGGGLIYKGRGSGDFELDNVSGDADIRVSGSGDVDIHDGNVDILTIKAKGASDVRFDGTAETAELSASGASDIYVGAVTGKSETRETGSADIDIGN